MTLVPIPMERTAAGTDWKSGPAQRCWLYGYIPAYTLCVCRVSIAKLYSFSTMQALQGLLFACAHECVWGGGGGG